MFERINVGALKEKELLEEKLSKEISLNFSISEKLAKKFIFEAHLSLEDFKNEIQRQQKNIESKGRLTKQRIEKLYFAILQAKQQIEKLSQDDLEMLKQAVDNNEFIIGQDSEIIKKLFSKGLLEKAKKPKKLSEHIMGASLGVFNSTITIGEIVYSIGMGFIKTPTDLIAILRGNARLENYKKL